MKLLRSLHQPQQENTSTNTNYGLGITNRIHNPYITGPTANNSRASTVVHPRQIRETLDLGYEISGLAETEAGAHLVPSTAASSRVHDSLHYVPAPVTNYRRNSNAIINPAPPVDRQPTLFTKNALPDRKMAELKNVLGKEGSGRLHSGAKVLSSRPNGRQLSTSASASPVVALEQAKSRPRVELDLLLDSGTCVESGYLKGKVLINVRPPTRKEGSLYLGGGKVRVVGFEAIPFHDLRYTFYHCGAPLDKVSPFTSSLYTSEPDVEGFYRSQEGNHVLPFAMRLPPRDTHHPVAKGAYNSRKNGSSIRYIAMVSIKMKDTIINRRSIAHFYRTIELWPLFDPKVILAPSSSPVYATVSKDLFLGGEGTLKLTASMHRLTWVAGQRCYIKVFIANDTEKRRVHTLNLSLIRSETTFKPVRPVEGPTTILNQYPSDDRSAYQASTVRKIVARTSLEMGDKAISKHSTAKGWWTGVDPGSNLEFNHYIILPPFALTIPRGQLIEVDYTLDIGAGTGPFASDVSVTLPIRIINYISVDPPPTFGPPDKLGNLGAARTEVERSSPHSGSSIGTENVDLEVNSAAITPPPVPPIPSIAHHDDNGTYRGSVGMPNIGMLRVQNCASNDMVSSGSRGFSTQGNWLQNKAAETVLQPALQESDEGLVEPERERDEIEIDLTRLIRPPVQIHEPLIGPQSVLQPTHTPSYWSTSATQFGNTTPSSNRLSSGESSDEDVDFVLKAANSEELMDEVPVDQIEPSAKTDAETGVESTDTGDVAAYNYEAKSRDPAQRPTTSKETEEKAPRVNPNMLRSANYPGGTVAYTAPHQEFEPRVLAETTTSLQNRATPRRLPLTRPRPQSAFMPKGTTLRQSLDLSKSGWKRYPGPRDPDRISVIQQIRPETIESNEKEEVYEDRTRSLQVVYNADQKASPLMEIPASVSALMRQDLKTLALTSQRPVDLFGEFSPQASVQMATLNKSIMVGPELAKKTGSSIQSRIAMFEQKQQGGESGRPQTMWTVGQYVPQPSRTGVGDPFRSKRL
ncbi:hypothetical protein FRC20_004214 [Serendipita sp. 405]|nr:hypothetical protein FRC20_004214 [Serendipita sp. 405]